MGPLIAIHSYNKDDNKIKKIINPQAQTFLKPGVYLFKQATEEDCIDLMKDIKFFNLEELQMTHSILNKNEKYKELAKKIHIIISMKTAIELNKQEINNEVSAKFIMQMKKVYSSISEEISVLNK